MGSPKVSVIIPVYGVEKYIERCARSLFEQTLDNIEFIFIDDCSPDNSIPILRNVIRDYPDRESQIRIIRMPANSGQAVVRAKGIQLSRGEYIIHCDSDDWVEKETYELLYKRAVSAGEFPIDIVFCDFDRTDGIRHILCKRNPPIHDKSQILAQLISGKLMGSLCGALIRKDLYLNNKIKLPDYDVSEDLVYFFQLCYYADTFAYVDQPLYHYYFNKNSITTRSTKEKALKIFTQAIGNGAIILNFIHDCIGEDRYREEIEVWKFGRINTLSPFYYEKRIRKMWNETFPEINIGFLRNKAATNDMKLIYILVKLWLFPLIYRLRHYRR